MRRSLPFVIVLMLGVFSATYVVEAGKYSCSWTIIGYVCPEIPVATN